MTMKNDMTSIRVPRPRLPAGSAGLNKGLGRAFAGAAAAWVLILAAAPTSPAWAHEGHDHGDDTPATTAPADKAPRASKRAEAFELVATMEGDTLTLHLDDADTNEPVRGAKVEIASGAFKAMASMQAPGVYTAAAPWLARPGRHAMTVSVKAGDKAGLMALGVETPAVAGGSSEEGGPAAHGPHRGLATGPWAWALGVAAVLAAAAVLGLRARSRAAEGKAGS